MGLGVIDDVMVLVVGIWVEDFSLLERQEESFRGGRGIVQSG